MLAGVFKRHDEDNTMSIEQDDDGRGGVPFVSASADIFLNHLPLSVEEYTSTMSLPESLELINTTDLQTILHIQHTRFMCGSVALGIHFNHCAGDAHSYFQLVRDWAQLYKNSQYHPVVCHQRSLLEPTLAETAARKNSHPNFNNQKTHYIRQETLPSVSTVDAVRSVVKIFRFSCDELNRMKLDATSQLPFDVAYVSTFDALTAHLYRHIAIARRSSSSMAKLYISTDIRPRLRQPLVPSTYFGNAIVFSYLEMETTQLISENRLGPLSSQVHQAIVSNTSDEIRTTLAWITSQPDKSKIAATFDLDKADFIITAWNKMNMYSDSDFEPGVHPCRIALPCTTSFKSAAIFFSTEKNDTSIDVVLGLAIEDMERLESNSEFRKYQ
ncbi:unnamed protein product [Didymodactylos carnosus]|uniref:Uncharacterized protein n=1 Tax=Didymodactylos carnosus TaxID=1234261 RepID=A0A815BZM3_9BILA|nr:unnamed protein product [Didymodactylos carnosus]CAF1351103.1 unnamed protein product [Didymodactylos carnosus]CAF4064067.1 unnamed protein product [Didymodactylos carnosus]CAF4161615.1 unnamed protein product [Didymodactylos carnosus]